jgi:hypothetical protein
MTLYCELPTLAHTLAGHILLLDPPLMDTEHYFSWSEKAGIIEGKDMYYMCYMMDVDVDDGTKTTVDSGWQLHTLLHRDCGREEERRHNTVGFS